MIFQCTFSVRNIPHSTNTHNTKFYPTNQLSIRKSWIKIFSISWIVQSFSFQGGVNRHCWFCCSNPRMGLYTHEGNTAKHQRIFYLLLCVVLCVALWKNVLVDSVQSFRSVVFSFLFCVIILKLFSGSLTTRVKQ